MLKKIRYSNIESIVRIAKRGGMYILVDDENRENEGDLVFCASDVDQKKINFMAKNGRGLICLTLNNAQAKKLNLNVDLKVPTEKHLSMISALQDFIQNAKK